MSAVCSANSVQLCGLSAISEGTPQEKALSLPLPSWFRQASAGVITGNEKYLGDRLVHGPILVGINKGNLKV